MTGRTAGGGPPRGVPLEGVRPESVRPGGVRAEGVGAGGFAPESVWPESRPTAGGEAAPYERFADLSEQELRLAEAGDLDALAELQARRAELIDGLPSQAPPAARAALERAAVAHRRTAALLATAHAEIGAELRHLARGQAAARSYAPAAAPPPPSLDRPA